MNQREIKCPDCDYVAKNNTYLILHLKRGKHYSFKVGKVCKFCGKILSKRKPKEQGLFCNQKCYSLWRHENNKGKKATNYKDGHCGERLLIRASLEFRQWREKIFKKDNYTCQDCGDKNGSNLEPHHIKSFALYPELRFEVSNGQTLCGDCHKLTKNYGYTKQNN